MKTKHNLFLLHSFLKLNSLILRKYIKNSFLTPQKIAPLFDYALSSNYAEKQLKRKRKISHEFEFREILKGKSISAGCDRWRSDCILLESGSQWMQVVVERRHGKFLLHWEAYSTGACADVSDFYFFFSVKKKKMLKV